MGSLQLISGFSILFLALSGCLARQGYLDRYAPDAVFPKSSVLLQRVELQGLAYYKLTDDLRDPRQVGTVYESWGDRRFIANANLSLRYRHRVRTLGKAGDQMYFPVAVSLDLRCPLGGQHRQAAHSWLSALEQHLRLDLNQLHNKVDQLAGCEATESRVFTYEKVVSEISVNELPQRGLFLSVDVYEKSFYEQSMRISPISGSEIP